MTIERLQDILGCTVEEKDGVVVFTPKKEEVKKPEFKDGDILVLKNKRDCVFVFNSGSYSTSFYVGLTSYGKVVSGKGQMDCYADVDFATEAEKQRLFDALAKEGKCWNADKKCIEDLPYKPKDKELVWAWDEGEKTQKEAVFYDENHTCAFWCDGTRDGHEFDCYAPFEGEWPEWAKEAFKKLED